MNDLLNGWPEDGEPVLTMSDEEMVEWCNKTQDTIIAQRKEIERLTADCEMKDKRIDWTVSDNVKKALEIERLKAVVAAAKDWFLDDSELGETDATLIMVVGNYLATLEDTDEDRHEGSDMNVLDRSHKKKIGGPITLGDDDPVTKYKAESDGRMFWAYNGMEVFYADERMYAALDEIERLHKQKQIAVDALFSICQSDWGVGHSLAKPAHKAIKELAALEGDDG